MKSASVLPMQVFFSCSNFKCYLKPLQVVTPGNWIPDRYFFMTLTRSLHTRYYVNVLHSVAQITSFSFRLCDSWLLFKPDSLDLHGIFVTKFIVVFLCTSGYFSDNYTKVFNTGPRAAARNNTLYKQHWMGRWEVQIKRTRVFAFQ